MKKIITVLLLIILFVTVFYRKEITEYLIDNYILNKEIVIVDANKYQKKQNYGFVQITDNFIPRNKQELINIFYTILDYGWDEFSFYCSNEYKECANDLDNMIADQIILSNVNNFVHPYNSYSQISVIISDDKQIDVVITKSYTEEQITTLTNEIDKIYNEIINDSMSTRDMILAFHDYVINKTTYDNTYNKTNTYHSNLAYGPLIMGKAICGGYADAMALFLNKIGVTNYKIASEKHVWNLVLLDGKWYHLDLTWDDPIVEGGLNLVEHDFFLLTDAELKEKDEREHNYKKDVYIEAA